MEGNEMKTKILFGLALVFLFIASVRVWSIEHQKVNELKAKLEQFERIKEYPEMQVMPLVKENRLKSTLL